MLLSLCLAPYASRPFGYRSIMDINKEHRVLLIKLGLKEEDFKLFDGNHVIYEYDDQKGVRLYDPYYKTSYNEYMGIDGWSSWSSEEDTFMGDMVQKVNAEVERARENRARPDPDDITDALKIKFKKKPTM